MTMNTIGHVIDGCISAGTSGRYSDVFNPDTGAVQAKVSLANADELNRAVASAKASVKSGCSWSQKSSATVG